MSEVGQSTTKGSTFVAVLQTMRPHQWVKNVFVLAPLFFSQAFWDVDNLLRGLLAALLFSTMAGTVYLINDIVDRKRDRRHPTKRHRPIASGRLPVATAKVFAGAIGLATLLGAVALNPLFAAVVVAYLVMNLAYSGILKEWAYVDVSVIAIGFVLRVLAGGLAVGVFLSEWLIVCTFLLACFLGLGKRLHELYLCEAGTLEKPRAGWSDIKTEVLEVALFAVGGLTVAAYSIYALTASLPEQPLRTAHTPFSSPYMPVTIPLVVLGMARFYQLARKDTPLSPTESMLRDPMVLGTVVLWVASLVVLVFL